MKHKLTAILAAMLCACLAFTACTDGTDDAQNSSTAEEQSAGEQSFDNDAKSTDGENFSSAGDGESDDANGDKSNIEGSASEADSTEPNEESNGLNEIISTDEASEAEKTEKNGENGMGDTEGANKIMDKTDTNNEETTKNQPDEGGEAPKTNECSTGKNDDISEESDSKNDSTGNTETGNTEHTHNYKLSVLDCKYATCTEDGYFMYKCSCGDSYTEVGLRTAKGHSYFTDWVDDEATRTASRTCDVCGETVTQAWEDFFIIKESDIDAICDRIIELLNEERAKLGAPALSTAPIAHEMAMVRAEELTVLFSHQRPNSIEGIGSDSATIYYEYKYNPDSKGRYVETNTQTYMPFSSSEDIMHSHNVGATTDTIDNWAQAIVGAFSTSPGHWTDLMNPEYTGVGVGFTFVINSSNEIETFTSVLTMDKTYG